MSWQESLQTEPENEGPKIRRNAIAETFIFKLNDV